MPSIADRIRALAEHFGDAPAHRVVGGGTLTYAGWYRDACRLANGLADRGVTAGDPVGLIIPTEEALRFVTAYAAAHLLGAVPVLLSAEFSDDELETLLDHADPDVVIATDPRFATAPWDELMSDDDDDPGASPDDDDPADVLYTAGTTGNPKAVLSRHRDATQAPDDPADEFTGQAWLTASPLASVAGQSFIVTPPALGMTTLVLPLPFDPDAWLDTVENEPVMACFLTPYMVERILAVDSVEDRDLASLQMVSVGSAPIRPVTLRRLDALLPNARPQQSYSMTEIGSGFTVMPDDELDEHWSSVGRPIDPLRIRIVDPETGEDLPPGETGEVLATLGDDHRHREYWRDDERNREVFEDGWMHTGDVGHLDEDGFLYLAGRSDDVIIRAGYNVHPADVEDAAYELDGVRAAVAVGVPHDELINEVVLAVVPADDGVDPDAIQAELEQRLGDRTRPDRVVLLDELPRNQAGKILRDEVVEGVS